METFYIKKGKDIRLKGAAEKQIDNAPEPKIVAIQPPDFKGIKPRLLKKLGDEVKVGTPVVADKRCTDIHISSPVSGKIIAVNRGEKRLLLEVVIESDGKNEQEDLDVKPCDDVTKLSKKEVTDRLLAAGLFATIRQRPFSKFAHPEDNPKSIFVHAMSTEPLSADVDFILEDRAEEFQIGLDVIGQLTDGKVHLCFDINAKSQSLVEAKNVNTHTFSGAHPTGNVGTHIHYVDPINKGDLVWFIEAQDVLRIAKLFSQGIYSAERVIALTGEGTNTCKYLRTVTGAAISELVTDVIKEDVRYISGSVLSGREVGEKGFLGYYDSQITVLPAGGKRQVLGWLSLGVNKYTLSHTYLSAFLGKKEVSLDSDENGSHRAMVMNNVYDSLNTLDILTYFLLRAVISGDIEESERLGILECDQEDFALATFACVSKTDVGGIIDRGLNVIEKEG